MSPQSHPALLVRTESVQSVRGMADLLPHQSARWQRVEQVLRELTRQYHYREIRPPIVEHASLFKRSIGAQTDIVAKEMYSFTDKGDEQLSLRPEATASCMRAGLQHGLFHHNRQRLWYMGPMFRRERPQKGRYRQFHQFGVEAVGWAGPDIDAEVLLLSARLFRALGVPLADDGPSQGQRTSKREARLRLHINTLGSDEVRRVYRRALVDYFEAHKSALDDDSKRRLVHNPLRILDSKNPQMQELLQGAPQLLNYLQASERAFFERLCTLLDATGITYTVNPHLVRGLDYYTSTVFEWSTGDSAQNALCAGGRYDHLVQTLGGKATPAVGFALGLERLLALLADHGDSACDAPQAYLTVLDDAAMATALGIAEQLRDAGITVHLHCGGGAIKNQLRDADRSGARYALLLGGDEVAADVVAVKDLRSTVAQQRLSVAELILHIKTASHIHNPVTQQAQP